MYDSTKQSRYKQKEGRKKEELGSGQAYNSFPKVIHGQQQVAHVQFNSARNCLLQCIKHSCPRNAAQTCSTCLERTTSLRPRLLLYPTRTTSKRQVEKPHNLYLTVDKNIRISDCNSCFLTLPTCGLQFLNLKMFLENYYVFFPNGQIFFHCRNRKVRFNSLPWLHFSGLLCLHAFVVNPCSNSDLGKKLKQGQNHVFFQPSTKTLSKYAQPQAVTSQKMKLSCESNIWS